MDDMIFITYTMFHVETGQL